MSKWNDISKYGEEMIKIPQGTKKETMAREILALYLKIKKEIDSGSDAYDENIGRLHAYAMSAYREMEMYPQALEAGEEALLDEAAFDDEFTIHILSEMLGICTMLYKKSDNRMHLKNAQRYGKRLLGLNPYHKLKTLIQGLEDL